MFVAINNTDMNVFQVDEWIKRTRDANNGIISPDFAMDILSKINHFANVKKVLKTIKDGCKTKEELLPYREFVLSCVDGREMSDSALNELRAMADVCDVREEFEELNNKPKLYNKTDADGVTIKSKEDLKLLKGSDLKVYVDIHEVFFGFCDLSKIKALKFRENSKVDLSYATDLPSDLDVSMCSEVDLSCVDLCNVGELSFAEGAEVQLICARNLPSILDVSMCSSVDLSECDLGNVGELSFAEGAKVLLFKAENLPADLDVSMCSSIDLSRADLGSIENLKFRDGAKVRMCRVNNLPKDLDVSRCSYLALSDCDLSNVTRLDFKEGAEVILSYATNLPSDLDVSMCSKVDLSGCDLSEIKELKFKDKKQKDEFLMDNINFEGKIVYVGDKGKSKNVSVNIGGGMDM